MATPLFAPWLMTGELKPKKVEPVRQRLLDALQGRPFPLHVNVLWNVLYWNWLPDTRCYEHLRNTSLLEQRDARTIDRALSVGAFVELHPGEQLLWGEVVYKERIVPALNPDVCSWEVDEHALDPELASARIEERLVLDFETSVTSDQHKVVARQKANGKLLDEFGHLSLGVRYGGRDALLDDAAFFVEYLLDRHGPSLLREYSTLELTEEQTRAALLQSIGSIRDILATTPKLRCWGDYWFTEDNFRQELELYEGRDRINSVRSHVVRLPARHKPVGCHAVTLAIREYFARGGIDSTERDLLSVTEHVARVCHTNAYLALAADSANGYAVREIARRVNGGIWRSQRLAPGQIPAYASLPTQMEIPFGRELPGATTERTSELLRELTERTPEPHLEFRVQRCEFRTALTQADIDTGRLHLGRAIEMLPGQSVAFKLIVPQSYKDIGTSLAARVDRDRGVLTDIDWHDAVYPGLYVFGTIEEGAQRVHTYVRPLPQPATVEGSPDPLPWEFDLGLWRAALRAARGLPPEVIARCTSPADLVASAFRHVGTPRNGGYVASLTDLYVAIVRDGAQHPPDLDFAQVLLNELVDNPSFTELPDGRFTYQPRVAKGISSRDATTLAGWHKGEAGRKMRAAVYSAETWVRSFHLRKREHKDRATWEQRQAAFHDAARSDQAYRYINMKLPEGYTYVRASVYHRRTT